MDIQATKTGEALRQLFVAKCIAHAHYQFYATEASRAGFEAIAAKLREAGDFELEHARRLGRLLHLVDGTAENLRRAAAGQDEREAQAAAVEGLAHAEGLDELLPMLRALGRVARETRRRFERLAERLDAEGVFGGSDKQHWQCRACGWLAVQEAAPLVCDLCGQTQAFFQVVDPDS